MSAGILPQKTSTEVEREAESASQTKSRVGLYLMVMLLACYSFFVYRGVQWNPDSRLSLTFALVEQGSLSIDAYHQITQDKSFYNGHYYTDKAIGLSLLAAPFYYGLRPALSGIEFADGYFLIRYALTFFVVAVPSSLMGVLLYGFLRDIAFRRQVGVRRLQEARYVSESGPSSERFLGMAAARDVRPATAEVMCLAVSVGVCLGTAAFPFSTVFFGHQLAALFLFASFLAIFRKKWARRAAGTNGRLYLVIAGFLAGYAALSEYPAFIGVALLGIYATASDVEPAPRVGARLAANAAAFLLGMTPPVLAILAYNYLAFGHPLSQGYAHLGGASEFIDGMSRGFMGVTLPNLEALWGITFSPYRGVFFLSPFLLLAVPGLYFAYRNGWRDEARLFSAMFLGFLALNSSYEFWNGGHSLGPRHVIPALPFLAAPVMLAALKWPRLAIGLISVSIVIVGIATATDALPDPIYANPLFDRSIPRLLAGNLNNNWGRVFGLNGVASLIPLGVLIGIMLIASVRDLLGRTRGVDTRAA